MMRQSQPTMMSTFVVMLLSVFVVTLVPARFTESDMEPRGWVSGFRFLAVLDIGSRHLAMKIQESWL